MLFESFASHNARGYSNDRIAEEHDDHRDELACGGDRGDVAIADGGDGDNSPVDPSGDAGNGGVGIALNAVHCGSKNDGHDEYKHHEYEDFHRTATKRVEQKTAFVEEAGHFEDSENTQHTHHAEHRKGGSCREEEAEIGGQDREKVNNAIEGKNIFPGLLEAIDAEVVFESEENGESPTEHPHGDGKPVGSVGHTFENDNQDVESDADEQPDVEFLSGRGIGFEDDSIDLLLGEGSVAFGEEDSEEGSMEDVADKIDNFDKNVLIRNIGNPLLQLF